MHDKETKLKIVGLAIEYTKALSTHAAVKPEYTQRLLIENFKTIDNLVFGGERGKKPLPEPLKPAVPVEESIHDDYLICLEDGQKRRMLGKYLQHKYGLTPDQYRLRWDLPADYPMSCKSHCEGRRVIAVRQKLGEKKKK